MGHVLRADRARHVGLVLLVRAVPTEFRIVSDALPVVVIQTLGYIGISGQLLVGADEVRQWDAFEIL